MLIYPDEMALIKGHPYFAHIENDADIKWFLQCMDAKLEAVEAGTALCREGEKSEFVPVVLKGETDGEIPRFGTWQQIESESGLSHSIIALIPPVTVTTGSECFVPSAVQSSICFGHLSRSYGTSSPMRSGQYSTSYRSRK